MPRHRGGPRIFYGDQAVRHNCASADPLTKSAVTSLIRCLRCTMLMISRSSSWGLCFGGLAALVVALLLTLTWSSRSGAGSLIMLLVMFVPAVTIMGGLVGGVLFGLVGVIIALSRHRIEASTLSYALLGGLLSLGVLVPYASWVANGLVPALQGRQGVYVLLPTAFLPVVIVGFLVGAKVALANARAVPPPLEGGSRS